MSQKRALVLEDDFGNQELMRTLLQMEGYLVEAFDNGHDGLKAILERQGSLTPQFDLVVSDIGLYGMNGNEVLDHVRSEDIQIPFVVASGSLDRERDILEYSNTVFISKPYRINEFFEAIKVALPR